MEDRQSIGRGESTNSTGAGDGNSAFPQPPSLSLPKGGGAIRGIGEKFAANPVTGTGSMSVPVATSPGRSGFGPQLSLSYDSGAGNGPFGLGWDLSLPAISRKTEKGLPRYEDAEESDEFILSGAEDLVPLLVDEDGDWVREVLPPRPVGGRIYRIQRYRPRTEGLFARIERWTNESDATDCFWRSISRENITTWYGKSDESRIVDPADATRIFNWLICESYDDKGNVVVYGYEPENSTGIDLSQVHEANRTVASRSANRYVKRIRYGNRVPFLPRLVDNEPWPDPPGEGQWLFEVVFDYGEHDASSPAPGDAGDWLVRNDPFSSCRPGFELRTYRLCQRVLMFHHFPDEADVGADCLVRSTDFDYRHEQDPADRRNPIHTVLTSVTQCAYRRLPDSTYRKRNLPLVEFEYSEAQIHDAVQELDPGSLENLPIGLDGGRYQWVDLDGEGLSGVLTEQAGAWFYKRNLSPANQGVDGNGESAHQARLGSLELARSAPSSSTISSGQQQLLDLAGDGQLDLVALDGPAPGFFERAKGADWKPLEAFKALPVLNWADPNLRFVDLTGDGHADILITEHDAYCWWPSLAEAGFGEPEKVRKQLDEELGPRVVFGDETQSIHLADLSGDGLSDLVRIRNGEVCYWPNLGYGRFGAKVSMDNAPLFDAADLFDQRRIRLADIDGSGVTDILYLGSDGVHIYLNQSGNSWSDGRTVQSLPSIDNLSTVVAIDLLGNGTACLAWSSPLAADVQSPLRYIDLMGGQKPHLMIGSKNNMGAETCIEYAPSTKFYVADRQDGKPWITRIPFPVHVVERVETWDHVRRNRFVTRYAYHHGYFDGAEREFRGFGMVEQWDTEEFSVLSDSDALPSAENIDESSHVPPVHTKTWFHTGVYLGRQRVSKFFAGLLDEKDTGEYYREPDLSDDEAAQLLLPDTVLPDGLSVDEEREACRALRGSMLRREVYALDGTGKEPHPYTVTEQNFTIRVLQSKADNAHGVFLAHPRESLSYHYERKPANPRVSHALTLAVDDYGNVLQSAAIGYGRRQPDTDLQQPDQDKQTQLLMTCSETSYTNAVEEEDNYRSPLPSDASSYELTGLALDPGQARFRVDEVQEAVQEAERIDYHHAPTNGAQKRVVEQVRTLYRPDDLGVAQNDPRALLPLGVVQPHALPGQSYQLAITPEHLELVFGDRVTESTLSDEGGYLHFNGDENWWIPSGRVFLSPNENDDAAEELAFAQQHFRQPHRFRNPFGHTNFVVYDEYDLLPLETRDPLDNLVTAGHRADDGTVTPEINYRVLQPELMTDPNGNRTAVRFDTLGLVAGTAVMGKEGEGLGDSLEGFEADLSQDRIDAYFAEPRGTMATEFLGDATSRIVYDVTRFQRLGDSAPGFAATLTRETHASDPVPADGLKIQVGLAYSDGFGRVIQSKAQAEPGPVEPGGTVVDPRWVGSGWTVFNNKGDPVKQYEPFFSASHDFEFARSDGVSPTLFYDPLGRVVATLNPNNSWEKVVFDPWRQKSWDVNDTILFDPANDDDVGDFFRRLAEEDYLPTWHALRTDPAHATNALARWPDARRREDEASAAAKAAAHADTPATVHFDSLGRPFLSIADNGPDGRYETRTEQDVEGATLRVIDARGNAVMVYQVDVEGPDGQPFIGYDVAGRQLFEHSMDGGDRRVLPDIAGIAIRAWDSRGHRLRTRYDELRRPTHLFVQHEGEEELLAELTVYGERHTDADRNLRGQVYRQYDGAGVATSERFDFKGNVLQGNRRLAREYRQTMDWSSLADLTEIASIEAQAEPLLESQTYSTETQYDAVSRPIAIVTPDGSVTLPGYNEANLLERMAVRLRGATTETPFVTNIDHNAKGQRVAITYATRDGSNFTTTYDYEPDTFRLSQLRTERHRDGAILQDLTYAYDPAGNITAIPDDAQQTVFFDNTEIEPHCGYSYDALYRLTQAEGREHAAQNNFQRDAADFSPVVGIPFPNSPEALQRYIESYAYDEVGNILSMSHTGGSDLRWKRCYQYAQDSNRLLATGGAGEFHNVAGPCPDHYVAAPTLSQRYEYDFHGNMTQMPHLPLMVWDFQNQLQATSRQVVNDGTPETTYYRYDSSGQRVRKVTERSAPDGETPTRMKERIYLGGFEVFREYDGTGEAIVNDWETLHVMDDAQRIVLVETLTLEDGADVNDPLSVLRYQLGNHLGSAIVEVDDVANVISYEEFQPYGASAYRASRFATEIGLKRYRYSGKELDQETGLQNHGARTYAYWLGRWTSPDPVGIVDGNNLYMYVADRPTVFTDPSGFSAIDEVDSRGYSGPTSAVEVSGNEVTLGREENEGLAGSYSYGQVPQKENLKTGKGQFIQHPPIAREGDRSIENKAVYENITDARKALRELFFIKGTARWLFGELGKSGEFTAGIAEVNIGNVRRFAVVGVIQGKEREAKVNITHYEGLARRLGGGRGKLKEIVHSHPSGIRAFMELGTGVQNFSPEDEEIPRDTGVPLGLLTPYGELKILYPGRENPETVLEPVAKKGNQNVEFVPDRPDLKSLVRQEVLDLFSNSAFEFDGEVFTLSELSKPDLSPEVRRKLSRQKRRLDRKLKWALRHLKNMKF